jgi:hypothetical protein
VEKRAMRRKQQWCIITLSLCINLAELCALLFRTNASSELIMNNGSEAEKATLPKIPDFPSKTNPNTNHSLDHAMSSGTDSNDQVNLISHSNKVRMAYSSSDFNRGLPSTLRLTLDISLEENIEIERLIDIMLQKCVDYERSKITPPSAVEDDSVVMYGKIPKLLDFHKEVSRELKVEFAKILGQERGEHIAIYFTNSPLFSCLLAERELLKGVLNHTPTNTQYVTAGVKTRYGEPGTQEHCCITITSDNNEELFRKRYLTLINWREFLEN